MKSVELQLNKRLLIVESDNIDHIGTLKNIYKEYGEFICKGSELTEKIAKGFVRFVGGPWNAYVDYSNEKNWISTSLQSFFSAIESKGYHWGENPVKFNENEINWEKRHKNRIDWEKAESRTFNPEKTLIFEIL